MTIQACFSYCKFFAFYVGQVITGSSFSDWLEFVVVFFFINNNNKSLEFSIYILLFCSKKFIYIKENMLMWCSHQVISIKFKWIFSFFLLSFVKNFNKNSSNQRFNQFEVYHFQLFHVLNKFNDELYYILNMFTYFACVITNEMKQYWLLFRKYNWKSRYWFWYLLKLQKEDFIFASE